MSFISRVGIVLIFLAAALPFALSTAVGPKECSQDEFWHAPNACCLPNGGPPSTPSPPKGTKCPPSHYWGVNQGCCVPFHPPPEHAPPPQCPGDWDWTPTLRKCIPAPTHSFPPPSSPSGYPGHGDGHDGHGDGHGQGEDEDDHGNEHHNNYKRSAHLKARSTPLCPAGLDACPIMGAQGEDYECLDTATELESCGGCVSLGSGQDCTAIPGAWNVGCEQGRCAVYTCAGGFKLSMDGTSCIPLQ